MAVLLSLVFVAAPLVHADESSLTGTALSELKGTPPEPPAGFATPQEAMTAVVTGKVKLIHRAPEVPDGVEIVPGVEYGKAGDISLQLDLYRPKTIAKPVPALVFIHGGAWAGGDRGMYRLYGIDFAKRGYVVASVSYRLSKVAPFPAAVQDVKCAVRYLRANAEKYHIDPEKIAAIGGSAGGHLAMMIGYSSDVPEFEGESGNSGVSSRVQAVVNLYGPTDLTDPLAHDVKSVINFMGKKTYKDSPEIYKQASPITYVTKDDPPTLILHGTIDEVVQINQADLLVEKLKQAEVPYIYDRLPGWTHAMDVAQVVNDRCQWLMEHFLARYVPLPQP